MSPPPDGTRPAINYKLKDNPFFAAANKADAKPPSGASPPPKRTVKQWQPPQSDRKTVRASVQKMAASSTVSANPWKAAANMANNATKKRSLVKKSTEQDKPSVVVKKDEQKIGVKGNRKSVSRKSSSSSLSTRENEAKSLSSDESTTKADTVETSSPAPAPASAPDPTPASTSVSASITTSTEQKEPEQKTVAATKITDKDAGETAEKNKPEKRKHEEEKLAKDEKFAQNVTSEPDKGKSQTVKPATQNKEQRKPESSTGSAAVSKESSITKQILKSKERTEAQVKHETVKNEKVTTSLEPVEPSTSIAESLSPPALATPPAPQSVAMIRDSVPVAAATSNPAPASSLGRTISDEPPGSPKPAILTAFGMPLPWGQFYAQPQEEETTNCTADSQEMLKQLDVSYAVLAALDFPTLPPNDADKWREKHIRARSTLLDIQKRIELEQDLQQSVASLLKIEYDRSLISEIQARANNMRDLMQELFAAVLHAQDTQSKYLKHLAGTLATAVQTGTTGNITTEPAMHQTIIPSLDPIVARVDAIVKKLTPPRVGSGNVSDDDSLSDESVLFPKSVRTSVTSFDNSSFTYLPAHDTATSHLYAALEIIDRHVSMQRRAEGTTPVPTQSQQRQQQQQYPPVHVWLSNVLRRSIPSEAAAENVLQEMMDRNRQLESQLHAMDTQIGELKKAESTREAELLQRTKDLERQLQHRDSKLAVMQEEIQRLSTDNTVQQLVERNNQLERELQTCEARIAELEKAESKSKDTEQLQAAFQAAQEEYTRREAAWMLQSASVEAELGSILKEYDRLTRNITDFNHERKKYEEQITTLSKERQLLDKQLADYRIRADIGKDGQTMTLRKEFRQLMATVKSEHQQELDKEIERRHQLEQELRDAKHELEMKRWDMNHAAVQTHFVAYPPIT